MRKFSWILALMLALSMAFVGCSSGGGDGDGDGGGGGGGGGDATVTLPEGSITDITVDSALIGYWDGDDANGTLVFTASGVGTDSADTTKAGMILFALKTVVNVGSTIEITGGKITSSFVGVADDMYSYEIADGVLTIKARQGADFTTVAFVGTLRSSSGGGGGSGDAWNLDALKALAGGITLYPAGSDAPTYDSTTKVVTLGVGNKSSEAVNIKFTDINLTGVAADSTLKVTYACVIEKPTAKISIKPGIDKWSPSFYKDLEEGKSKTFEIDLSEKSGLDSDNFNGLLIQHNADTNNDDVKYYVKVLSVEIVE